MWLIIVILSVEKALYATLSKLDQIILYLANLIKPTTKKTFFLIF